MNTTPNDSIVPTTQTFGKLWALFVLIFIDSLNYFLVIPVFERLFAANSTVLSSHFTEYSRNLLFGFAVLLSPLAFVIFSPIVGYLSDRFGRKRMLIACLAAGSLGSLLPISGITTHHLWPILLGRFIAGASTGSQPIAQAAVADLTHGKQKAVHLALIGFCMTVAMTLGPTLGASLSDTTLNHWLSLTTPYWVSVFLSLFNLLLLIRYFHETHAKPAISSAKQTKLFTLLKTPPLFYLLSLFFMLEFSWSLYYQVLFLIMPKEYHYTTEHVALFVSYIGLWMSFGLLIVYPLMLKIIDVRPCTTLSLWLATLGFIGLCTFSSSLAQWLFSTLIAVFTGTAYVSLLALLSNATNSDHQGVVLGLCSTMLGLTWTITAFLGSALITSSLHLPFYLATFILILASVLALKRKVRHYP